ncbi:pseudouridine synthase [Myxococcus stipitatus]|uniref:pseudouridine synthase n=1 Tax=Myxococcus stipitatus TaxID=83455 RepID=UPI001F27233D|nr:pseudouridine synthase [Myxococcus stipitatus]MCE9667718.1 pseudouridine synthase [Myxococcus stipitatus]
MSAAPANQDLQPFPTSPAPGDVPARLPSPFTPGPPHPLALLAARALQRRLLEQEARWEPLWRPGGGKMFGVLAVSAPDGRLGYLSGFSGMLEGHWDIAGFAPPVFAPVPTDAAWKEGEAELASLKRQHAELVERFAREAPSLPAGAGAPREHLARRREVERLRAGRSRALWRQRALACAVPNARGEHRTLADLFAPRPPPGGAGECAAPKLLAHAYRLGLAPLALAEFWWGAPPLGGGRHSGEFYPACDGKCGAVLPFMMEGLETEPSPRPMEDTLAIRLIHADDWLLVVDKPHGLPSTPGRHSPSRDSVLLRLRERFLDLDSSSFIQELEPEASGLQLVARDAATRAALQRQLAKGEAAHRHAAWVEGVLVAPHGVCELPLRGTTSGELATLAGRTLDKRALTKWAVSARVGSRTRVSLWPWTRHPLQLRLHAAHPEGLGAPLVGDARFGREDTRLMLHAEEVSFVHPVTGARLAHGSPAPF